MRGNVGFDEIYGKSGFYQRKCNLRHHMRQPLIKPVEFLYFPRVAKWIIVKEYEEIGKSGNIMNKKKVRNFLKKTLILAEGSGISIEY